MTQTVLITGVAGFLGSHLADEFLAAGYEVKGIDSLIGGYLDNVPSQVNFLQADLDNVGEYEGFFAGVDLVVHAACTAYEGLSVFSPALVARNTFQITANVLSQSVKHKVKKFIYLSSMARYGSLVPPFTEDMTPNPQDPYGISKYAAELITKNICETHGMEYVILVPHNIIGPRQKFDDPYRNVASIMINRMLHGKQPIIYGDGNQLRCFSFISDVTKPLMHACTSKEAVGEVINIGPDEEVVTINRLAQILGEILYFEVDPIYMRGRPKEVFHASCSSDKARRLLGYETSIGLKEGLIELSEWIQSMPKREFIYHLPIEILNEQTPETWSKKIF